MCVKQSCPLTHIEALVVGYWNTLSLSDRKMKPLVSMQPKGRSIPPSFGTVLGKMGGRRFSFLELGCRGLGGNIAVDSGTRFEVGPWVVKVF